MLFKQLFHGSKLRVNHLEAIEEMAVIVPYGEYKKFMQFKPPERAGQILVHITNGLYTSGLVGRHCFGGRRTVLRHLNKLYSVETHELPWMSMIAEPAPLGFELFLWAHGRGDVPLPNFMYDTFHPQEIEGIPIIHNALRISDFR
jgi:hypothetical protein